MNALSLLLLLLQHMVEGASFWRNMDYIRKLVIFQIHINLLLAHGLETRAEHDQGDFGKFNWPWTTDFKSDEPVWPEYSF